MDFEHAADHESDDEYKEESESNGASDDNEIDGNISNIRVYNEPTGSISKPSNLLTNNKNYRTSHSSKFSYSEE